MKHPLLAALALTAALGACAQQQAKAPAAPSLTVSANAAGNTVTVDEATLADGGWLVIHATKDGKPVVPASIGHARLAPGTNRAVTVTLSEPTKPGDVVISMLHHDTGAAGTYEFGPGSVNEDKPVVVDGKPVVRPIKIN